MVKNKEDYNFKTDIKVGEKGEKEIIKDLEKIGGECIYENKDINFDLVIFFRDKGILTTYEVKTDVFCKPKNDTGNMFIEFECRGKMSGISVTKSEWFVTYYPFLEQAWYIKTEELKNLIKYNNFRRTELSGDSGSNTKGVLIPREIYKKHFKVRNLTCPYE